MSNIWTDATGFEDVDVELRVGRSDWTDTPSEKLSDEYIVPICGIDWDKTLRLMKLQCQQVFLNTSSIPSTSAIELAATSDCYAVVIKRLVDMASAARPRVGVIGEEVPIPNAHYLMRPRSKRSKQPEVLLFENWLQEEFSEDAVFEFLIGSPKSI